MQPDVASYTDDSLSSPRLHPKGRSIRETSGSLESTKSVREIDIKRTSLCLHEIVVFTHLSQVSFAIKKVQLWFFCKIIIIRDAFYIVSVLVIGQY